MMAILDLPFCISLSDTIECYDGHIGSSLFVLTYQTLLNAMMAILDVDLKEMHNRFLLRI